MTMTDHDLTPLFLSAYDFPHPECADPHHHELIAVGADLEPQTLLHAYSVGLFPWFNQGEEIAWYSPSPRCVLYPQQHQASKSLLREMKKSPYVVKINQHFQDVIRQCAAARAYSNETWIGDDMIHAYQTLHALGYAISVEIWHEQDLIGGLYGLKIGHAFFGESMFHTRSNASKMAFFVLARLCAMANFKWIDCQLPNEHLMSLGAKTLERKIFLQQLPEQIRQPYSDWSALYDVALPLQDFLSDDVLSYQQFAFTLNKNKV
ncbi:MAG: leucyl/phenylalanyl-tRNA--protein transferase [Acinetobacter sp.]|nr:leucyl/phenylalanyl-tRNA--protein transferase [Acinetobacter sp.]